MGQVFAPLPPVPDHPRLEEEILQWWEDEQVFQQLRDKNHGGPKFSFMDGPITANAPAGGWLYMGHRSTQWCPRCGTSLSKHEQAGDENYEELEHPSLFVRFPLVEREGEALVIWTTTPWTLPANVAAAVKPDAQYGRSENGDWVSVDVFPGGDYVERLRGEDLVGLHYRSPFEDLPAQQGVEHRVIPWDDVALDEGTGIVHIAPGCGAED